MENKQEILGQYFTKIEIVRRLLDLLFSYKKYDNEIKILEPSFGTGNFINGLNEKNYLNIDGCEIDKDLSKKPCDFFEMPLAKKYDLLIGNPPFSKYNLKESYFSLKNYIKSAVWPSLYLTKKELKKDKEKIENIFILKSLKHIKDENSSIGYVLPISFFIKNKDSHRLCLLLDEGFNIAARSGFFCDHFYFHKKNIPAALRFSFAFYNTEEEINFTVDSLKKIKEIL